MLAVYLAFAGHSQQKSYISMLRVHAQQSLYSWKEQPTSLEHQVKRRLVSHVARGVNTSFLEKLADAPGSPFAELGLAEHAQAGNFQKRQARQQVFLRKLKFDPHIGQVTPQDWGQLYDEPSRPLWVDLGCGSGRCLLALAQQQQVQQQEQQQEQQGQQQCLPAAVNYLGIDVKAAAMERANSWAELLGVQGSVHFLFGNATVSLGPLLASYPGPLTLVALQYPDPEVRRHLIMQRQLAQDIAALLAPGGRLVVQSDVRQVAGTISDVLLQAVAGQLELGQEHLVVGQQQRQGGRSDGSSSSSTSDCGTRSSDAGHSMRVGAASAALHHLHQGQQQGQQQELQAPQHHHPAVGAISWELPGGRADVPSEEVSWPQDQPDCLLPWLRHTPAAAHAAAQHASEQQQQQQQGPQGPQGCAVRWLGSSPLGMPTERELYVRRGRRPIWRFVLRKPHQVAARITMCQQTKACQFHSFVQLR